MLWAIVMCWLLYLVGQEQQTDAWSSKAAGAENNDCWNTKAEESSCNTGAKWEDAASGSSEAKLFFFALYLMYVPQAYLLFSCLGEKQQGDPWSNKTSSTTKGA